MISVETATPGDAFRHALDYLMVEGEWQGQKKELLNFVVEVSLPWVEHADKDEMVGALNRFHDDPEHFQTVSEWTFPEDVKTGLTGAPAARSDDGEYFERLCESEKGNQLTSMVEKIEKWGRNNRTVAQVFQVDRDLNAMFPPCLLDIQVFYRDDKIHLTGHYRSHTVCKSYYGDIVSLTRLQKWLADEVDAGIGSITVISGSLHIRKKNDEHKLAEQMYEEFIR